MGCGGDGILEKMYIVLRSFEMVSLLRVLYILQIYLCLPLLWLSGNCGDLGKYGFGVADIPKAVDLMYKAFAETTKDRHLMLDYDFIMNIFEPLAKTIKLFKEYLTYMFEEQQSCPVVLQAEEDKIYPYDLLRAELYFPMRKDILQSNKFSALISFKASSEFRVEFRDERTATAKYVSDIKGANSMKKVSKIERDSYWGIDASNSISKILHASSTVGLKFAGIICLDHCAAERQTSSNNDFGERHASLFTGCKWKNKQVDNPIGVFHLLPEDLQRTAVLTSK